MMIDWTKALKTVAAMPEVKRVVAGMRDKGIAQHLITLGLMSRPSFVVPAIGFFAAGAVCGAAAAMLVTPRTGEAFRQDIADFVKGMGSKIDERVSSIKARDNGASAMS